MKTSISIPIQPLILVVLGVVTIAALGWAMFVEQTKPGPLVTIRSQRGAFPDADEQQPIFDDSGKGNPWVFRGTATEAVYNSIIGGIRTQGLLAPTDTPPLDTLPEDTFAGQIGQVYTLGDLKLAIVHQRNKNTVVEPTNRAVFWSGVMVQSGNSSEWRKYYVIQDPSGSDELDILPHNVTGLFIANDLLYLDVADAAGSDDGHGMLTRLVSSDGGKTWKKTGCYYFDSAAYYANDGTVDQSAKPEISTFCRYGE